MTPDDCPAQSPYDRGSNHSNQQRWRILRWACDRFKVPGA